MLIPDNNLISFKDLQIAQLFKDITHGCTYIKTRLATVLEDASTGRKEVYNAVRLELGTFKYFSNNDMVRAFTYNFEVL